MFDTMTLTKVSGAVIGALLFMLLANWGASALYTVGGGEHAAEGHEGEGHAQAYTIPVADAGGEAEEEETIDFAALMAEADAANGEGVFRKCAACHKVDGSDGVGPHLNGVVGREIASVGGFGYSDAMVAHASEVPAWEPDALQAFLENPRGVVAGTSMGFAGLSDPQDRADLIAYLQTTN